TTARRSASRLVSLLSSTNARSSAATSPFDSALAASTRLSVTSAARARRSTRTRSAAASVALIRPRSLRILLRDRPQRRYSGRARAHETVFGVGVAGDRDVARGAIG